MFPAFPFRPIAKPGGARKFWKVNRFLEAKENFEASRKTTTLSHFYRLLMLPQAGQNVIEFAEKMLRLKVDPSNISVSVQPNECCADFNSELAQRILEEETQPGQRKKVLIWDLLTSSYSILTCDRFTDDLSVLKGVGLQSLCYALRGGLKDEFVVRPSHEPSADMQLSEWRVNPSPISLNASDFKTFSDIVIRGVDSGSEVYDVRVRLSNEVGTVTTSHRSQIFNDARAVVVPYTSGSSTPIPQSVVSDNTSSFVNYFSPGAVVAEQQCGGIVTTRKEAFRFASSQSTGSPAPSSCRRASVKRGREDYEDIDADDSSLLSSLKRMCFERPAVVDVKPLDGRQNSPRKRRWGENEENEIENEGDKDCVSSTAPPVTVPLSCKKRSRFDGEEDDICQSSSSGRSLGRSYGEYGVDFGACWKRPRREPFITTSGDSDVSGCSMTATASSASLSPASVASSLSSFGFAGMCVDEKDRERGGAAEVLYPTTSGGDQNPGDVLSASSLPSPQQLRSLDSMGASDGCARWQIGTSVGGRRRSKFNVRSL